MANVPYLQQLCMYYNILVVLRTDDHKTIKTDTMEWHLSIDMIYSKKSLRRLLRDGWRNLRKAFASI